MSYLDEAPAGTSAELAPSKASQPKEYLVPETYRDDMEQFLGILSAEVQRVSEDLEKCHAEGIEALTALDGRIVVLEERQVIAEAETEFQATTLPAPTGVDFRLAALEARWSSR